MTGRGSLLMSLSLLYGLASRTYHGLYDRRWLRPRSLPVAVISVGNLTVGGTGKTPVVLALARELAEGGIRPAILTRGYRGTRRGILRAALWESGERARAVQTGDEALLLSRSLPSVPVVIDPDRARGGRELLRRDRIDVFLLDDGMQHRRLSRRLELVLLDAGDPLGNGKLLPSGPLREPPDALRRADHLILTGGDGARPVSPETASLLDRHAPGIPRTRAWTVLDRIAPLGAGGEAPDPAGQAAVAVAGLARPERFTRFLEGLGIEAVPRFFPDHHPFTAEEVRGLEAEARARDAVLLTTAKDAVRLEALADPRAPWRVVDVHMEAEGGWRGLLDRHRKALAGS